MSAEVGEPERELNPGGRTVSDGVNQGHVLPYRVLSIDGGGIRGIIPAVWLQHLEERLSRPLNRVFNLFVGTSTGSIIAAGLAGGLPAQTIVELYENHGSRIFPQRGRHLRRWARWPFAPLYHDGELEEVLKKYLGGVGDAGPALLRDLGAPCVVTTYNVYGRSVILLSSYDKRYNAVPVWEACKASCSAPTYFGAHVTKLGTANLPLVDGGVVANNPGAIAMAEAIRLNRTSDLSSLIGGSGLVLVSLGTGDMKKKIAIREARTRGAIWWSSRILNVMFDGSAQSSGFVCERVLPDDSYYRFQMSLTAAREDLDLATPENINALKADAETYLTHNANEKKLNALLRRLQ